MRKFTNQAQDQETKAANIAQSYEKQSKKNAKARAEKIQKFKDSYFIKDNYFNLMYMHLDIDHDDDFPVISYGTVSLAYKFNVITEEYEVFYTIRSPKDCFSRPVARRNLVESIKEGTYNSSNSFVIKAELMEYAYDTENLIKVFFTQHVRQNTKFLPSKFVKGFFKYIDLYGTL